MISQSTNDVMHWFEQKFIFEEIIYHKKLINHPCEL